MDADGLGKRLGNGFQKQIAVLMSKSIIDMLEIIQIHIQHGALAPCSLGLFNVFHQVSFAAHAVIKTCQEVCVSLLFNPPLVDLLFGHIIDRTEENRPVVHPLNAGIIEVVPVVAILMINLTISRMTLRRDAAFEELLERPFL